MLVQHHQEKEYDNLDSRTSSSSRQSTSPEPADDELEDLELLPREPLPRVAEARQPSKISFIYADGTEPRGAPPAVIYRYHHKVQVAYLDLRSFTRAFKAAKRGFYFDAPQEGNRLYLKVLDHTYRGPRGLTSDPSQV